MNVKEQQASKEAQLRLAMSHQGAPFKPSNRSSTEKVQHYIQTSMNACIQGQLHYAVGKETQWMLEQNKTKQKNVGGTKERERKKCCKFIQWPRFSQCKRSSLFSLPKAEPRSCLKKGVFQPKSAPWNLAASSSFQSIYSPHPLILLPTIRVKSIGLLWPVRINGVRAKEHSAWHLIGVNLQVNLQFTHTKNSHHFLPE